MQHELSLFYIIIIIVLSQENKYTIQNTILQQHKLLRKDWLVITCISKNDGRNGDDIIYFMSIRSDIHP